MKKKSAQTSHLELSYETLNLDILYEKRAFGLLFLLTFVHANRTVQTVLYDYQLLSVKNE